MSALIIVLLALSYELLALFTLIDAHSSGAGLAHFALIHAVASALLAWGGLKVMPVLTASARRASALLMFSLSAFVPLLGFCGVAVGLWAGRYRHAGYHAEGVRTLRLPQLDPHQRGTGGCSQAGVTGFLGNPRIPTAQRMKALVALQHIPGRISSPLLRKLLGDTSEDLRLLAYGMLEHQEKALNDDILAEQQRLDAAHTPEERTLAHRRLAGLYWELIYHELAQGDLRRHAAEAGLGHVRAALALQPDAAGLRLRCGQFLNVLGDTEGAHEAFELALQAGIPSHRVLPLLAEQAFRRRDYKSVRALLAPLEAWHGMMRVEKVVSFWHAR